MKPKDTLVDLCAIGMRSGAGSAENAAGFFRKIKNPYHFRVGDIAVNVQFSGPGAASLQSCVEKLLTL